MPRMVQPEVVVHYWDGSAPEGRCLRDISQAGAYIYTTDRWYPGTIIRIVLQGHRTEIREERNDGPGSFRLHTRAGRPARHGRSRGGVCFSRQRRAREIQKFFGGDSGAVRRNRAPARDAAKERAGTGRVRPDRSAGVSSGCERRELRRHDFRVDYGSRRRPRSGAQYMVVSSSSPGAPTQATQTQITALVTSEVTSLRNRASVVVATCSNATTGGDGVYRLLRSRGSVLHPRHRGRDLYLQPLYPAVLRSGAGDQRDALRPPPSTGRRS